MHCFWSLCLYSSLTASCPLNSFRQARDWRSCLRRLRSCGTSWTRWWSCACAFATVFDRLGFYWWCLLWVEIWEDLTVIDWQCLYSLATIPGQHWPNIDCLLGSYLAPTSYVFESNCYWTPYSSCASTRNMYCSEESSFCIHLFRCIYRWSSLVWCWSSGSLWIFLA